MTLLDGQPDANQGPRGRTMQAHAPNQGATNEWLTPKPVFDALGCEFDLDPSAPRVLPWWIPAKRHYSLPDDGLALPWEGRVWLNPPYSDVGRWMGRLADHGNGIALVFARTDVRWWHSVVPRSSAVCFIEGRLSFIPGAGQEAKGNSGGPSVLVAYGADCAGIVAASGLGMTLPIPLTAKML